MKVAQSVCFHVAQWMRHRGTAREAETTLPEFGRADYQKWRESELRQQFHRFFSKEDVAGRDVIDFGCGGGELSVLAAELGARTVLGMDVSCDQVARAKDQVASRQLPCPVHITLNTQTDRINADDNSADVILCFDVLEHVMDYDAIIQEWYRVLRPGGRVLIWWVPWWNPYGPHIEALVPIPWAHVFFSDRTLIAACARVYDSSDFKPRVWDLDENGCKKDNKWRTLAQLPGVNKLTVRRFERLCGEHHFATVRREYHGFGGTRMSRMMRPLTLVPYVREFFLSTTVYELRKD